MRSFRHLFMNKDDYKVMLTFNMNCYKTCIDKLIYWYHSHLPRAQIVDALTSHIGDWWPPTQGHWPDDTLQWDAQGPHASPPRNLRHHSDRTNYILGKRISFVSVLYCIHIDGSAQSGGNSIANAPLRLRQSCTKPCIDTPPPFVLWYIYALPTTTLNSWNASITTHRRPSHRKTLVGWALILTTFPAKAHHWYNMTYHCFCFENITNQNRHNTHT